MGGQAFYFPVKPKYTTSPGFLALGTDLGNDQDNCIFQLDSNFSEYRNAKLQQREHLDWHLQQHEFDQESAVTKFVIDRLLLEHPADFRLDKNTFSCLRTGETLLDGNQLVNAQYTSALDAIASNLQEDITVLSIKDTKNWMSYLHVMFPSGWDPRDRIGKSFAEIHEGVPGMEAVNARSQQMIEGLLAKNMYNIRFLWMLGAGTINRHPAYGLIPVQTADELHLRVERQGFIPIPQAQAFLFTIRIYLYPCAQMPLEQLSLMRESYASFSPELREYKDPEVVDLRIAQLDELIQRSR